MNTPRQGDPLCPAPPSDDAAPLLNRYAFNVTSQDGEDGILDHLIGELDGIPTMCCEFGAWDGKHLSNTYTLWHDRGWKAILIEADPARCAGIRERAAGYDVAVIEEQIAISGAHSLDALFRKQRLPRELGVLSIDIDSCDYHVWRGLREVTAWVVVIEHNPSIPASISYFDPEDEVFFLCSVGALAQLGERKSYRLVCCTHSNSIFVRQDHWAPERFPLCTPHELFAPRRRHRIIDSYSTWMGRGKNRYPAFTGAPSAWWPLLKWLRFVTAKLRGKPFVAPSERIRRRAQAAGIHCP